MTLRMRRKVVYGYLRPQLQAMHLHFLVRGFFEKMCRQLPLFHSEKSMQFEML